MDILELNLFLRVEHEDVVQIDEKQTGSACLRKYRLPGSEKNSWSIGKA